jgi:hypothetical protein
MPRPQSENTFQVAFKIPEEWVKLADDVAEARSQPGVPWNRTDALRAALVRGLEALRAETRPTLTYRRVVEFVLARKTVLPGALAGEFGISIELANEVLHKLKGAGVLQAVSGRSDRLLKPGEQAFRSLGSSSAEAMKIVRGMGFDPDSRI